MAATAAIVAGCGSDSGGTPAGSATETTATGETLLIKSAVSFDDAGGTLPLLQGKTATGADTWYVVTESSDQADAEERGVNWAPKLAKALGTKAVQKATVDGGVVTFPGTVDFAPERSVTPGPDGFPPTKVAPGDRRRGLQPARHDRREDGAERHSGRE